MYMVNCIATMARSCATLFTTPHINRSGGRGQVRVSRHRRGSRMKAVHAAPSHSLHIAGNFSALRSEENAPVMTRVVRQIARIVIEAGLDWR